MCDEHSHLGAIVEWDSPALVSPVNMLPSWWASLGSIAEAIPQDIWDILGNMKKIGNRKVNKWSGAAIDESDAIIRLQQNDLGIEILRRLKSKVGWDLDRALELYTRLSSFGIDKALGDLKVLIWDKKLHPETVENAVFWKTTTAAIASVNDMIQESRDERQWQKTYAVKTPAFIAERVFPILARIWVSGFQDKYRIATLEANIGWAISQIGVLSENRSEMDAVVQWVKDSWDKIRVNQQELYRQYATMVYIAAVLEFHIAKKREALDSDDLDPITLREREMEVSKLERQLVDIQSMAWFIEARAIIETHNAERADITAQNIENEYLMAMYVLAQKIQNYMVQEWIIKWVNLWLAIQQLKWEAMGSFFEDQRVLNDLQTQLEQSWLDFLVDLDTQIKALAWNIARNNDTLAWISERQRNALAEIGESIGRLEKAAVPHLVDMRDDEK